MNRDYATVIVLERQLEQTVKAIADAAIVYPGRHPTEIEEEFVDMLRERLDSERRRLHSRRAVAE